jgi:crossover junction endodeoxyribonuclease RuvC
VRILGIDPGSHVLGYAVITASAAALPVLAYVECGVITAEADAPLERRLGEIAAGIREIVAELAPDAVAMEDVFHGRNTRSMIALAQARGAALVACDQAGLEVASYAPAVIKLAVTGRGRADKAQVGLMVRHLLGLKRAPRVDATDALAVAVTHALRKAGTRRELAALAGVRRSA